MKEAQSGTEHYVIVGFGWVGQANALAIKMLGFDVSFFDLSTPPRHYPTYAHVYDAIPKLSEIRSKDAPNMWYIVCVGDRVSEDGVQDISNIKSALNSLSNAEGGIILRSTILPDLLDDLKFDYYLPEFLHEKQAVEECLDPHFFVVGERHSGRSWPALFTIWRARSRKIFKGTPREASFIKYLSNLWNATRIAFVNEFGDAIGRPTDKKHLEEIECITDFLFDRGNYLRYGRAFGGHCLPKDTRAFRARYGNKDASLPLIAGVYESNTKHQQLEKTYPLMPEWYSEWSEIRGSGRRALQELWHSIRKNIMHPITLVKIFSREHTKSI